MKRLLPLICLLAIGISLVLGHSLNESRVLGAAQFGPVRGSSGWTIESGGVDRTFRMYVPAGLDLSQSVPLVVMLHGRFQNAREAERYYGWNDVADIGGFVVAYPDGIDRAWNGGGGCCREPGNTDQDDVGFVLDIIDLISSHVSIDPDRVFAAGMSNGGKLAYRVACETDRFAAIAPVAALQLVPCDAAKPTSLLVIHGVDDRFAPIEGGLGAGSSTVDVPSVPDTVTFWRTIDKCGAVTSITLGDVTDAFSPCPDGRAVELLTVMDMGHVWPGGGGRSLDQVFTASRGGDDFVATIAIWEFFDAHPRVRE